MNGITTGISNVSAKISTDTLQNIIHNLIPWWHAIYVIGLLLGLVFLVSGLFKLGQHSKGQQSTAAAYVLPLIAGILLINLGSTLDSVSTTLFNVSSTTGLDRLSASQGSTDRFQLYALISYGLTVLVGLYGLLKGGSLLHDAGRSPDKIGPGITHVFGGILAVNIDKVILAFGAMVGGTFFNSLQTAIS